MAMLNNPSDSCPLDILIAQTQRELLQAIADAVEPMGWRCNYVELYIEDGLPMANAQMSIQRSGNDAQNMDREIEDALRRLEAA